ncbi:MAG TPA: metallophosphoesterase [Candidatus Dormibacteraeota bacterium]|nr:metallophosphoesterase [Candidatus Dormibacteraeota bacterium]
MHLVRLLHCADMHIDAAFQGLGETMGKRRRAALRQTFQNVVKLALELQVDALTIGGDLYEDLRSRQDAARFLAEQLGQLPFPVLIAPGNHDYWHPGSLYATNDWPDNVLIFSTNQFSAVEVAGHRIFGVAHDKPKGTGNLLAGFKVPDGLPAIALFHGSERGQLPAQGEGKEDHAPFSEMEIAKAGFRFGLLGHFHKPRTTAHLVYPGNPEPLTFGEDGLRGAAEVDFTPSTPSVKIHPVNTFSLTELEVDVTDCQHSDAVLQRVREALPQGADQGARVKLVGEMALGMQLGPSELVRRLREGDRCVDVVFATRPALDLEQLKQAPDIRGQFVRGLMERPDFDSELVQSALRAGVEALQGEEPAIL